MRAVPQPVVQGLSASSGATKEPLAPTRPTRAKSHQRRYPDQHRSPPFVARPEWPAGHRHICLLCSTALEHHNRDM